MAHSNTTRKPARARMPIGISASAKGFTMVELLVAMAIIVVLVSLLIPAVSAVRKKGQVAATTSLIASLDQACHAYSQDNNNLYPGQDRDLVARMDLSPPSGKTRVTGTQVMVAAVMGMSILDDGHWKTGASAQYLDIDKERLDYPTGESVDESLNPSQDASGQTLSGARYTVMDAFGDPLPILYFPSRPGRRGNGTGGALDFEDNVRGSTLLYPDSSLESKFYEMILKDEKDPSSPVDDEMRGQDSFLIISAGLDGEYFTVESSDGNKYSYDDLANVNLKEVVR